ncbi:MAG: HEAT repeat domain-containing protein [Planctomycetes bacterium]|nr:HEAT repeat domain-containing protein [Planctomycetota bacterium]
MNDTLKAIVQLLESGKPELQVAAAQVLGELQAKEPAAVRALAAAQRRSPVLGRFCLDALAKIGTADAIEAIAATLLEQEALAEHAAQLLKELGLAAHRVLAARYADAIGDQRARILEILGRTVGKDALDVFVRALLAPETAEAAGQALLGAADQFDAALRKQLRDSLAAPLDQPLPEVSLAWIATVLARVDAAGARPLMLKLSAKGNSPLVRSAAYRSLRGTKLSAAQVREFMDLLADPAEKDVHDAVRDVLADLPEVPAAMVPVLKRLLAARQPEQRLFALRMLRTATGAEMAKVALKLLDHDDERFRRAAADALAHNRQAIEPLVRVVQTARDPALAQAAADVLTRQAPAMPPKAVRVLLDRAVRLLPTNVRTADQLLGVVLASSAPKIGADVVDRAVRLRRARRHAEALHVLARLAGSAHAGDEGHYQLALTKLLQDTVRPSAEASSPGDPTMGFFATLVRAGFPLAERLRKESAVTPEALLRVATHFAEAVGVERRFGTELLQFLATRKKGRTGDEARVALRAVGG